MREKRNLIWLSIGVLLVATFILVTAKSDALQNLSIGIIASAFVSLVLVLMEYSMQKQANYDSINNQLLEIKKLLINKFRIIDKGTVAQEKAIKECLRLMPVYYFVHHNFFVIKAHVDDEIGKIQNTVQLNDLAKFYPNPSNDLGLLGQEQAALAIVKSRILGIINNIEVILELESDFRCNKIKHSFEQLCFFSDSAYQLIQSFAYWCGKKAFGDAVFKKTKLSMINECLKKPLVHMFEVFDLYSPSIFKPFREGYDGISLPELQECYFKAEEEAFSHSTFVNHSNVEKIPFLQFRNGLVDNIDKMQEIIFTQQRKKAKNA